MILSPGDNIEHEITPDVSTDLQKPQIQTQNCNPSPFVETISPQNPKIQNGDISKALRCKEEELGTLVKEISGNHARFFGDFSEMKSKLPAIETQYLVSEKYY